MTLPILEKTWVHTVGDLSPTPSTNIQVMAAGSGDETNKAVFLAIVTTLLSLSGTAKAHCYGSSNGVAFDAAGTPATSRLVALSDIVPHDPASPHTWIVLDFGDGSTPGFQILFDLDKTWNSYFRDGVRISISPSGAFTGGDASNAPTATDEILLLSHDSYWTANYADSNARVSIGAADDRSGYYIVAFFGGTLQVSGYIGKPKNPVTSGWTNQWLFNWVAGPTGFRLGAFNFAARIGAGTTAIPLCPTGECFFSAGDGTRYTIPGNFTPDDQTGEYPLGPIGLYSPTTGKRGRKGAIFDIYWGIGANVSGDTYPNDGSKQMVQFGDMVFPWDGSNVETI